MIFKEGFFKNPLPLGLSSWVGARIGNKIKVRNKRGMGVEKETNVLTVI